MDNEIKYTKAQLEEKLTEKEYAFCHEYIKDWNKSRAARDAGYSVKTATEIGYENMRKPHIVQYVEYIKDDIAKEARISKLGLILELKKIAMSDITDLYLDWFKLEDFNKLKETNPEILSCIQEINTKTQTIKSEDGKSPIDVEFVKVKMYDKKGAINDILRAMGWDKEVSEEMSDNTLVLKFGGAVDMNEYLSDENDSTE